MLIAEHSRCQPGRPSPKGLGHEGSPGRVPFHRAKSRASSFSYSSLSTRAPLMISRLSRLDSRPYPSKAAMRKYSEPLLS